ncbi:MAG: YlxR family protein [Acidimicrobiales bacterium]
MMTRTPKRLRPTSQTKGPIRTCVGCKTRRSQAELLRLHLDEDDHVQVGRTGAGRGAWLCSDDMESCLSLAVERKALARAFRRRPVPESVEALVVAWSTGDRQ